MQSLKRRVSQSRSSKTERSNERNAHDKFPVWPTLCHFFLASFGYTALSLVILDSQPAGWRQSAPLAARLRRAVQVAFCSQITHPAS